MDSSVTLKQRSWPSASSMWMLVCCLTGWAASPVTAHAQYGDDSYGEAENGGFSELAPHATDYEDEKKQKPPTWFVGAYYRQLWIPPAFPQIFLDDAPGVANPGAGIEVAMRGENVSLILGLGYAGFAASGPFRATGDPVEDTEYIDSTLGMIHASASVMWSTQLGNYLALEYGIGADLGIVTGSLMRNEAYRDPSSGEWRACRGQLDPAVLAPSGVPYCEPTLSGGPTDPVDQDGAHYNVREKRWTDGGRLPNIMLLPMLPRVGLRIQPDPRWSGKVEIAYSLLMLWAGVSIQYGL